MYQLHCPDCEGRRVTRADRREAESLANTHNVLMHSGRQVATVRNGVWSLLRAFSRRR